MNLQKKCRKCHQFFSAKPMELKFFCDKPECQEYSNTYNFWTIKSNRCINMEYFDIWDLDRPYTETKAGKILTYERVCRQCGAPLFNKDGKYSVHRRYCQEHTGYELFVKYNWGEVSKKYAKKVREDNIDKINEIRKYNDIKEESKIFTLCEECGILCYIYEPYIYFKNKTKTGKLIYVANIHHIYPVHKIVMKNIHLIWDFSNLKALCQECHHKQNHYLKKIKTKKQNFLSISSFL